MPEWLHTACGTVYSSQAPPLMCPVCAPRTAWESGWKYVGPSRPKAYKGRRRRRRNPIGPERRKALYARDGNRCVVCKSPDDLTLDHKIPISKGGDNSDENLQTMCHPCNQRKADAVEGDERMSE